MSLLKKENKTRFVQVSVKLEATAADKLKQYAEFLESTQAHVVSEAIHYIVERDREFKEFIAKQLAEPGETQLVDPAEKRLAKSAQDSPQNVGENSSHAAKVAGK